MKTLQKITFFFFLSIIYSYGQVGIGTQSPVSSSVLDITSTSKGVLIPRVALTATNSPLPLTGAIPNGTMVFNTANAGSGQYAVFPAVYVWNNTEWVFPANLRPEDKEKAVKYTNPAASTTNFNPGTVASPVGIDIFGTEVFNDDSSIFERIDNYQLKIKSAGLYLVSINLALKQNPAEDQSKLCDYIYCNLDGALTSAKISTLVPQYNPSKVNIYGRFAFGSNSYFNATAGQILTLNSARYEDGPNYNGTVNYDGVSLSSITIIKIK